MLSVKIIFIIIELICSTYREYKFILCIMLFLGKCLPKNSKMASSYLIDINFHSPNGPLSNAFLFGSFYSGKIMK